MRKCPRCSRVYADESLRFCLDDGGALESTRPAETTMRVNARGTSAPRTEVLPSAKSSAQSSKSVVPWVIAGAAILVAVFVVMASLGVLVFVRKPAVAANTNDTRPGPTPKPSATVINLAGTRWTDTYANIASKSYYFNSNGTINDSPKDRWRQNGNLVILDFNDGYARYEGTINGNQIDYKARNKVNFEWSATIIRAE